jgi:hypothetical protein
MKKILAASAMIASLVSAQAHAGGMVEPIMEQEIETQTAAGSRAGILVPILALILFGLAISNNDSGCQGEFCD